MESKRLKCDVCGKTFSQASTFSRHKDVHSSIRRFVCGTCGKAYKHLSGLKVHQKSHTGTPLHSELCDRRASDASATWRNHQEAGHHHVDHLQEPENSDITSTNQGELPIVCNHEYEFKEWQNASSRDPPNEGQKSVTVLLQHPMAGEKPVSSEQYLVPVKRSRTVRRKGFGRTVEKQYVEVLKCDNPYELQTVETWAKKRNVRIYPVQRVVSESRLGDS